METAASEYVNVFWFEFTYYTFRDLKKSSKVKLSVNIVQITKIVVFFFLRLMRFSFATVSALWQVSATVLSSFI